MPALSCFPAVQVSDKDVPMRRNIHMLSACILYDKNKTEISNGVFPAAESNDKYRNINLRMLGGKHSMTLSTLMLVAELNPPLAVLLIIVALVAGAAAGFFIGSSRAKQDVDAQVERAGSQSL